MVVAVIGLAILIVVLGVVVSGLWMANVDLRGRVYGAERDRDAERARADSAHALLDHLSKLVAKPPVVVPPAPVAPLPDLAAIAASMGEAIAKNLNPPSLIQPQTPVDYRRVPGDMADLHLSMDDVVGGRPRDPAGGEPPGPRWVPDTELFDRWIAGDEKAPYPTRSGWVVPESKSSLMSDVELGPQGVQRKDGQPMFRSGDGTQQPPGGVE